YRGASPVEGALLSGEKETGVAIQQMVYTLDAGDVLASETVPIQDEETTRELRPRLVAVGADLLVSVLPAFEEGSLVGVPQDHANATHTRKIKKEAGELSLQGPAQENWNRYRAYAESPGTYFFMEKEGARMRVKIRTATYENGEFLPVLVVPEGKNETAYRNLVSSGWTAL
ncbi:MAG: formyltransferase family protein, partial [Nitrospirota bacterium]|nr:formyltransferase family protein [Nitrospirota bacterium]